MIKDVLDKTLCANLSNSTILPAMFIRKRNVGHWKEVWTEIGYGITIPSVCTRHLGTRGLVFISVDVQHLAQTSLVPISQSPYSGWNEWVLQFKTVCAWYQFQLSIVESCSSKVLWFLPTKKDAFPPESVSSGKISCDDFNERDKLSFADEIRMLILVIYWRFYKSEQK